MPASASLLILCFYLSGVIFVPLWIRLSRKFGKARTIGWSSVLSIGLIPIVAFTPPGRVDLACAAFGSTMGAWIFLMKSIVADLVNDEEVQTGRHPREGLQARWLPIRAEGEGETCGRLSPIEGRCR